MKYGALCIYVKKKILNKFCMKTHMDGTSDSMTSMIFCTNEYDQRCQFDFKAKHIILIIQAMI